MKAKSSLLCKCMVVLIAALLLSLSLAGSAGAGEIRGWGSMRTPDTELSNITKDSSGRVSQPGIEVGWFHSRLGL